MICAPAAKRLRLASARGNGAEQPESFARTAQMITLPEGQTGVCAGGACGGSTVSTARRAITGNYATTVLDGTMSDGRLPAAVKPRLRHRT